MSVLSTQSLAIGIVTAATYLLAKALWRRQYSDVSRLPVIPDAHWWWGNELDAWEGRNSSWFVQNLAKYGNVIRVKGAFFHPSLVAISDPAGISHVFTKKSYSYEKSSVVRGLVQRVLGRSLIWAEGPTHKRQRQMLSPLLTHQKVRLTELEIRSTTDKLVDQIRGYIAAAGISGDETVRMNVLEWPRRAALDVIGMVGFGYDFGCGLTEESQILMASLRRMNAERLSFPGFVAPLVLRALPILAKLPIQSKSVTKQVESKNLFKSLGVKLLQERKAGGIEDTEPRKDILSGLLNMQHTLNEPLDALLDQIAAFVIAGLDTTNGAITFMLMLLAEHKDVQDRLREELVAFRGSGPNARVEPSYEDYQTRLPYLDAVMKETLRLWPNLTQAERVVTEDDVIPLETPVMSATGELMTSIRIQKGQIVIIPILAYNKNKAYWGEDAEEFNPDRWLSGVDGRSIEASLRPDIGWHGLLTFIDGPRMCLGLRLAVFEIKIIASALVKNFEWFPTGEKIVTQNVGSAQPFVEGRRHEGTQVPLNVRLLNQ